MNLSKYIRETQQRYVIENVNSYYKLSEFIMIMDSEEKNASKFKEAHSASPILITHKDGGDILHIVVFKVGYDWYVIDDSLVDWPNLMNVAYYQGYTLKQEGADKLGSVSNVKDWAVKIFPTLDIVKVTHVHSEKILKTVIK